MGMTWATSAAGVFAVAAVFVHMLVGALTVWRCRYRRAASVAISAAGQHHQADVRP
jgi:hypothetical protein